MPTTTRTLLLITLLFPLISCVTNTTTGPKTHAASHKTLADFAGTHSVNTENAIALYRWSQLSISEDDVHPRAFTLTWIGQDLQITHLNSSKKTRSRILKHGTDFTIQNRQLILKRSTTDNPYFPGASGKIKGESILYLDQQNNLVFRYQRAETGLLFATIPSSFATTEYTIFKRSH